MKQTARNTLIALSLVAVLTLQGCAIYKEHDRRAFYLNLGDVAMGKDYYAEAFIYYKFLANNGDAEAQYKYAKLFRDGLGIVHQNTDKAIHWYTKSADQGYLKAQIYLGNLFYSGNIKLGVKRDFDKSARWYEAAARQGSAYAQNNLGIMYCFGRGKPQNYAKAAHWFRIAANQGRGEAQYNLGALYYRGLGVPQDMGKAQHWFSLAAAQGRRKAGSGLVAVAQQLNLNRG